MVVADRFRRLYCVYSCFTRWQQESAVGAAVRRLHPQDVRLPGRETGRRSRSAARGSCTQRQEQHDQQQDQEQKQKQVEQQAEQQAEQQQRRLHQQKQQMQQASKGGAAPGAAAISGSKASLLSKAKQRLMSSAVQRQQLIFGASQASGGPTMLVADSTTGTAAAHAMGAFLPGCSAQKMPAAADKAVVRPSGQKLLGSCVRASQGAPAQGADVQSTDALHMGGPVLPRPATTAAPPRLPLRNPPPPKHQVMAAVAAAAAPAVGAPQAVTTGPAAAEAAASAVVMDMAFMDMVTRQGPPSNVLDAAPHLSGTSSDTLPAAQPCEHQEEKLHLVAESIDSGVESAPGVASAAQLPPAISSAAEARSSSEEAEARSSSEEAEVRKACCKAESVRPAAVQLALSDVGSETAIMIAAAAAPGDEAAAEYAQEQGPYLTEARAQQPQPEGQAAASASPAVCTTISVAEGATATQEASASANTAASSWPICEVPTAAASAAEGAGARTAADVAAPTAAGAAAPAAAGAGVSTAAGAAADDGTAPPAGARASTAAPTAGPAAAGAGARTAASTAAIASLERLQRQDPRRERERQLRLRKLRAELAASQAALARAHHELRLTWRWGLGPWMGLLERRRRQEKVGVAWREGRLVKGAVTVWKQALYYRCVGVWPWCAAHCWNPDLLKSHRLEFLHLSGLAGHHLNCFCCFNLQLSHC